MFRFIGDRFTVIWFCNLQTYSVYDSDGKFFGVVAYRFSDVKSYLGNSYKTMRS